MNKTILVIALFAIGAGAATPPPQAYLHISSHLTRNAWVHLSWGANATVPRQGFVDVRIPAGAQGTPFTMTVTAPGIAPYTAHGTLPPGRRALVYGKHYWCVNLLAASMETYTDDECEMDVADQG